MAAQPAPGCHVSVKTTRGTSLEGFLLSRDPLMGHVAIFQGSVDEAPRLAGCSIIMGPNVQELKVTSDAIHSRIADGSFSMEATARSVPSKEQILDYFLKMRLPVTDSANGTLDFGEELKIMPPYRECDVEGKDVQRVQRVRALLRQIEEAGTN